MENSSLSFHFNLTMFGHIGDYRYPVFAFSFILYTFIVSANVIIILVISLERSLHQPMYVLIVCLSVNSLYGSTGFFLRFLRDLLHETYLMSRLECFSQIYVMYTYASYEFTILSMMAYDRYVAVCKSLHYHNTMTSKMVYKLSLFALIYPAFAVGTVMIFSGRLPLCGSKIPRVFCANWSVVKLSCVDTSINNLVGMLVTAITVFIPLLFVSYTYLEILLICRKRSAEFKWKVFQSCLPHIVTFFSYTISIFCDITLSRYDIEELYPTLAVIVSLEFVVIPPILNPLMYGLKLPEMRRVILKLLCRNRQCKTFKLVEVPRDLILK
uniref:Olfactory receptor n=1 Tax=Gadus morhua TaxID=8049 RepID=A0A8C5ALL5_GADMO